MCEVGLEGDPPRVLDCAALRAALETGKATLENLIISVQSYSWSDLWYEDPMPKTGIRGTLNSLRDFENLVELEIPIVLLMGMDPGGKQPLNRRLPPNVRSLCLRDDISPFKAYRWSSEAVLEVLHTFVRDRLRHYPELKALGLILNDNHEDGGKFWLAIFQDMCQSAGIRPKIS